MNFSILVRISVSIGILVGLATPVQAMKIFNLNVFDQQQGVWEPSFREQRLKAIQDFLMGEKPEVVVLQEAQKSFEPQFLRFSHEKYVHEMTGADQLSYGYWMGSAQKPQSWSEDGFSFPGGVERRVQVAIFTLKTKSKVDQCLGVLSVHLSYQSSEVRQKEANWLLEWLKRKELACKRWLVVGDFNADQADPEMKILFAGGLKNLVTEVQPTVTPHNPIRKIYGDKPARAIDWALGWNLNAKARVVLAQPWKGVWVSDHAGLMVEIEE